MTRTVFDNGMTAHVWAQGRQESGRSANGNLFFDGARLYSYGRHYLAAYRLPDGFALTNPDRYSVSTARHVTLARRAARAGSADLPHLESWADVVDRATSNGGRVAPGETAESRLARLARGHAPGRSDWPGRGRGGVAPSRAKAEADRLAPLDPAAVRAVCRAVGLPERLADPCNADSDGRGPAMLALADVVTADGPAEWQADDARADAAARADRLAEVYAESEREWRDADRAGQAARDKAAEATAAGLAWVAALRALRGRFRARHGFGLVGLSPAEARALIRSAVAEARAACEAYRDARAKAASARRDRPGKRDRLADAWADGCANGGAF